MASFAERNREVAREWRALVELPGGWRRSFSQAGGLLQVDAAGEAGGFFVELDFVGGRRAYLKPLKRHGWRRAAREKIAADLAFELGLSVPPVLLAVNDKAPDVERHACVSLLLYPHQFSWGQLKDFLAEGESPLAAQLAALLPGPSSRALVFDTWLGQTDHNDHPSNIVSATRAATTSVASSSSSTTRSRWASAEVGTQRDFERVPPLPSRPGCAVASRPRCRSR